MDALRSGPTNGDLRAEIVQLEERIVALSDQLDRCGKLALLARVTLYAGAAWLVLMIVGALAVTPFNIVAPIAAVIGGIVLYGSNDSTRKQTAAAIRAAEARRNELIGHIDLQLVGDDG